MQILGNIFNAIIFVSAIAVYFVFYLFLSITFCVVRCRYGFRFAV